MSFPRPLLLANAMTDAIVPSAKVSCSIIPEQNRGKPWFDDGNVILMSHNLAFKVYKGMVSQHSTMLRDMLDQQETEVVDGCPAIQLEDATIDISSFLVVIHGCERAFQLNSKQDFMALVGVLRIATKYKAEALRQRALLPLKRLYPSKLSQWDEVFESSSWLWHLDPVTVTNVARELSAFAVLPAAMAFLANSTLAEEAFGPSIFQTHPLRFAPGLLNADDLKGFAKMKEYSHTCIARILRFIREAGKEHRMSCQRLHAGDGCATKFTGMFVALSVAAATSEAPAGYPSFIITVQSVLQREDVCGSCRGRADAGIDRRRRAWWRGLPEVLGFSGWEDVRLR
ncbi:hypothetical protein B0H15DRAFT_68879 [Mycena belliarum]|uniref:BTB domain-containing protein n=1 Tax=Mycena belliarum TaxID=1033014 RepID=A0AAD6XVI3_9AGAR|nr:hypothetical protein B0H15DRAFT_68879 [Mycena belliae]